MASGICDLGAPGLLYWLLTGLPVCCSTAAWSKKSRAAGVGLVTCTAHPARRWQREAGVAVQAQQPGVMHGNSEAGRCRVQDGTGLVRKCCRGASGDVESRISAVALLLLRGLVDPAVAENEPGNVVETWVGRAGHNWGSDLDQDHLD